MCAASLVVQGSVSDQRLNVPSSPAIDCACMPLFELSLKPAALELEYVFVKRGLWESSSESMTDLRSFGAGRPALCRICAVKMGPKKKLRARSSAACTRIQSKPEVKIRRCNAPTVCKEFSLACHCLRSASYRQDKDIGNLLVCGANVSRRAE